MTSRERIIKAINHQKPDRVPIDIGGTAASGISVFSYFELRQRLGLRTDGIRANDTYGMLAGIEMDMLDALKIDTLLIPALCPRFGIPIDKWQSWELWDGKKIQVPMGFNTKTEADGSLLLMAGGEAVGKMPKDGYHFSEIANSTMGGIDNLEEPPDPDTVEFNDRLDEKDLRFRQEAAKNLYENTDKALVVDFTDNIRWNTSIPNWFYAFASEPDLTYELHEKKSLAILEQIKQLAQAVGPYIQVFAIYQDWGTQRCEFIAPDTFRKLIAPHYKRIFEWIHKYTSWKVLFHSCGSIYGIIPHMIDMGVDILNPVQCNAANMEAERLKKEFGDRIVFWGGGVDTQTVLNYGSAEDVREQVQERVAVFSKDGGYVFAPTQDIQPDVPVDNIIAMLNAVHEAE